MSGSIFLLEQEGRLREMKAFSFTAETEIQALIARHPQLLRAAAGREDGQLLLVSQEVGIASELAGSDRFAVDHLFLDQAGVPVFVEVKRASDTRSRREVVAQMLDYVSNGCAFLTASEIDRHLIASGASEEGDRLQEFLGAMSREEFLRNVETNLRIGRVRMVFVADRIGTELRRIVEWLNAQLRFAEVLAIQLNIHQADNGAQIIAPVLIGATEQAQVVKAVTAALASYPDEWLRETAAGSPTDEAHLIQQLSDAVQTNGLTPRLTKSRRWLAFDAPDAAGKRRALFYLSQPPVELQVSLEYLSSFAAFRDPASRTAFGEKLQALVGHRRTLNIGPKGWPTIPLALLDTPDQRDQVLTLVREVAVRLKDDVLAGEPQATNGAPAPL